VLGRGLPPSSTPGPGSPTSGGGGRARAFLNCTP
jgi:hypothetical protein